MSLGLIELIWGILHGYFPNYFDFLCQFKSQPHAWRSDTSTMLIHKWVVAITKEIIGYQPVRANYYDHIDMDVYHVIQIVLQKMGRCGQSHIWAMISPTNDDSISNNTWHTSSVKSWQTPFFSICTRIQFLLIKCLPQWLCSKPDKYGLMNLLGSVDIITITQESTIITCAFLWHVLCLWANSLVALHCKDL